MRNDILRTCRVVHGWLGIVTGLFLFIAFYAGAVTIFWPALDRWALPPSAGLVTPLEQAAELIEQANEQRPESRRDFTVHLGADTEIPARMTWRLSRGNRELVAASLDADGHLHLSSLTPTALGRFIDHVHRTGGLPVGEELGTAIMGGVSLLYAVALISGLVIFLPSLTRDLFALRIGPSAKLLWRDIHNLTGMVSLPFHLVIALTAVVFCLHDEIYDALDRVVYRGTLRAVFQAENPFGSVPRDSAPAAMLSPAEILARLKDKAPGFQPNALQYRNAGTKGASVTVWGGDERYLMRMRERGFVVMSAVTGEIANTEYLPGFQGGYGRAVSAFFALHAGNFGGPAVKWGYFVLGLGGAFLFYSGNLLWIENRRRRDKDGGKGGMPSRSVRGMAIATTGVCLGSMIGVSLSIAASKWLHVHAGQPAIWQNGIFYAALFVALGWSFLRGPARARAELLWVSAAVTIAIPLTSFLAWVVPSLGLWVWQESIGVDAAALAGAVIFAALARRSARRVRSVSAAPSPGAMTRADCPD
ncbi:MAG: PepSY-associated TM helix domain-containing protein [Rhodospirillaceae bacterium]|nr:PepSY-associated TM helix domain-containing protein [Rhodospirillaceae bacterium]